MNKTVDNSSLEHVLITGAASGIGRACAEKLMQRGVRVAALDIAKPDLEMHSFHTLDLADASSIEQAIDFAQATGPFDALLNIAGVPPRPDQQSKILSINWLGQYKLTQGVVASIKSGGAIVNMASRAGARWRDNIDQVRDCLNLVDAQQIIEFVKHTGIDATRAYNLSKEAMIVWTMASAECLKSRHVRMNSVSPAAVETAILSDFLTAFGPVVEQNLARVGRPGQAHEVADVALFLASPQSNWLHGVDIVVDGGMGSMIQTEQLQLDCSHTWT